MKLMRIWIAVLAFGLGLMLTGSAWAEYVEIPGGERKTFFLNTPSTVTYEIIGVEKSSLKVLAKSTQPGSAPNLIDLHRVNVDKGQTKTETQHRAIEITFIVLSGKIKVSMSGMQD